MERYIESYCLSQDGTHIDSDDLLSQMEEEEKCKVPQQPTASKRSLLLSSKIADETRKVRILSTEPTAPRIPSTSEVVGRDMLPPRSNAREFETTETRQPVMVNMDIPLNDGGPTASRSDENNKPKKKVSGLNETNRILKSIHKQNDQIIGLLKVMVEGTSVDEVQCDYRDFNNEIFSIVDIPHSSPNVFAINFMKKLLGPDFMNTIIDPQGASELRAASSEVVKKLKDALSTHFSFYIYNNVRKAVNQAARDMRNRAKK